MNKFLKIFSVSAFLAGTGSFVACDNGSCTFDMDDDFEIVLDKANYKYKSKDSLMIFTPAECKVGSLDYLVWNEKSEKADTLQAYSNGKTASIRARGNATWDKYDYDGSSFPRGLWVNSSVANQSIYNGQRFLKSGVVETVFRYEGSCFATSLIHQFMKKNSAIEDADSALVKFYTMFKPDDDKSFKTSEMLEDLRAPSCDELTMYDGDVSIELRNFKSSSGTIALKYSDKICKIKFKMRYAKNKSDCEAAYADYQDDPESPKTFDFNDYSEAVDYDIYCVKELVLKMQKDKKILDKKKASADDIARSTVKFVLDGMK